MKIMRLVIKENMTGNEDESLSYEFDELMKKKIWHVKVSVVDFFLGICRHGFLKKKYRKFISTRSHI